MPTETGEPRPVLLGPIEPVWGVWFPDGVRVSPGLGDVAPIRWDADGRSLYVRGREDVPARVYRVDTSTGERERWKELLPSNPAGVALVDAIQMTPDGKSYAYSYSRRLFDLYLIERLR